MLIHAKILKAVAMEKMLPHVMVRSSLENTVSI